MPTLDSWLAGKMFWMPFQIKKQSQKSWKIAADQ
jgi:hypothetical protein